MTPDLPEGPFGTILADPAWSFKAWSGKTGTPHRTEKDHYKVMPIEQVRALPVADVAAKDCALFLWVVDSHLEMAFDVAADWGFTFKTRAFTWRKVTKDGTRARIGMGYWTRKQTELCLLFTRGKPRRHGKGVREIIDAPIREHSQKPEEQYQRIEELMGGDAGGPYLEMFARKTHPGWTAWGNETRKFTRSGSLAPADDYMALVG